MYYLDAPLEGSAIFMLEITLRFYAAYVYIFQLN